MKTIEYLSSPELARLFIPGVCTGFAMAVMCACLSVLVVLKKFSFIGQGISHAAFGGMGIAAVLGIGAGAAGASGALGQFSVVVAFCLAAALVIATLSGRGSTSADTAIGIVLVASMCLGGILLHVAARGRGVPGAGWESILFGSIVGISPAEAWIAGLVAAGVVVTAWWFRRPLLFWAFDESAAPAFGVRSWAMRNLLLVLLCLAIVTAMKVSGVVLATAMLVLPAAAALCVSDRLWRVFWIAQGIGLGGVAGGIVVSMELDWPPGPSVVAVLTAAFALCRGAEALSRR
ncbi:MAG: metal ABC transporter permease [Phycisphaeraceae bacterium]|nr:metal ABC transporter permease [Phycisphaerae bacterium]MBX3392642.1 metal ABC transporter permease [Phycisphaeraceae bacterium]